MSYETNPYYSPQVHGLTTVGEVEWSEPCWDFDLTAVWRDGGGNLYWADDSGCSCPSPFEDYGGRETLTSGTVFELASHLERRKREQENCYGGSEYAAPQIVTLLERIRLNQNDWKGEGGS